jgi:hypothetical protein
VSKKKKRKKNPIFSCDIWWDTDDICQVSWKTKWKKAFPETKCLFKHTVHILKCFMVFARETWIEILIFEMPCGLCKAGSNQCCSFHNALACMVFARQIPIGNVTESWYIKKNKKCMCLQIWTRGLNFSLAHEANWIQVFYLLHGNVEQDLVTRFKPFPMYYIYFMWKIAFT